MAPKQLSPNFNLSNLFSAYNLARGAARRGVLDIARVNRALGLVLANGEPRPYSTTVRSCTCPDRQRPCKHMLAKMLEVKAERLAIKEIEDARTCR